MKICSDIHKFITNKNYKISFPYKLPKNTNYNVKVTISERTVFKEKDFVIILDFSTKEDASEFHAKNKDNLHYFQVEIHNDEGALLDTKTFFSEQEAKTFIKQNNTIELKVVDDNMKKNEQKQIDALKNKSSEISVSSFFNDDSDDSDDLEDKIANYKEQHTRSEMDFRNKARKLITSATAFFLKNSTITDDSYHHVKFSMQEDNLSTLLMQTHITKQAVTKIAIDINTLGNVSANTYKALAELQRLIFDVTKYMHELLSAMEDDVKKAKDDLIENGTVDVESEEVEHVSVSNRSELIRMVQDAIKSNPVAEKIPVSANPKLRIDLDTTNMGEQVELFDPDKLSLENENDDFTDAFDTWDNK